nr:otoferlin-like [Cherax quadricarinatus]
MRRPSQYVEGGVSSRVHLPTSMLHQQCARVPQYTRVAEDCGQDAIFDEVLEWPVGRCVEPGEEVQVQLQVFNKYFSNRTIANYALVLQRLVGDGNLILTDHMTDANNKLVQTLISFEARYIPPPGKGGGIGGSTGGRVEGGFWDGYGGSSDQEGGFRECTEDDHRISSM